VTAVAPAESDASPFSRGTVIALILAGVFAFSALAVLASFAPDLRTGGDPRAHALSKSAVGFGGLVELLRLQGEQVVISRSRTTPANPQALRILTPEPDTRAVEVNRLAEGLTLIILPKWRIAPDLRSADWVSRASPYALQEILNGPLGAPEGVRLSRRKGGVDVALTDDKGAPLGAVRMVDEQFLTGLRPLVTDQFGGVIVGEYSVAGRNPVWVLADPDLLSTYGLRDLNGARTAMAVLNATRPGPGPIFFDVTLNGYERGRNLWKLAFEPPFLAATLCVLAAALMMGLQAAVRFGPARREERAIGMGKRALADNQAGLIRMAKREHRMAEAYARLVRDRTARSVGAGQIADEARLETLLDRLGRRRTELSIAEMSAESRQVADASGLMRLARRLHQWKLEISRERQ
jgi:hypothetical protein